MSAMSELDIETREDLERENNQLRIDLADAEGEIRGLRNDLVDAERDADAFDKLKEDAEDTRMLLEEFGTRLREEASAGCEVSRGWLIAFLEDFDLYDDAGTVHEHMGKVAA